MLSAHGSAPEVVEAARAEGRYVVNAVCPLVTKVHHEAKVRARKGFTMLYVGHAGHDEAVGTLAVAPDAIRLVERADDLDRGSPISATDPQVAMLAQTTLAQDEWTGLLDEARVACRRRVDRVAQRPLLRHDQPPGRAHRDRATRRRRGGDRQRQLVEHARAREGRARRGLPDRAARRRARRARPRRAAAARAVVGVTAGASAPEELVDAVIAALAPEHGVERVRVTDEDEYFPPPPELRELVPALDALAALAFGGDPAGRARARRTLRRRPRLGRVGDARQPRQLIQGFGGNAPPFGIDPKHECREFLGRRGTVQMQRTESVVPVSPGRRRGIPPPRAQCKCKDRRFRTGFAGPGNDEFAPATRSVQMQGSEVSVTGFVGAGGRPALPADSGKSVRSLQMN